MKKVKFLCMALLAVFMLASCAKEGPMGPVGPQGPQGPIGPSGYDGHDGNANVCSSTLTVYPNDWYWDNASWRVDFDYAAINANIYGSGAVLVYMKTDNVWNQLPRTFYYSETNDAGEEVFYSSSLDVSFYLEGVSVLWTESDFYDGYRPETHDFRIVVIGAGLYNAHPEVDYDDYESVKSTFGLTD